MITLESRVDQVYGELVRLTADVAKVPGTKTARIAGVMMDAVQTLADARALVIMDLDGMMVMP